MYSNLDTMTVTCLFAEGDASRFAPPGLRHVTLHTGCEGMEVLAALRPEDPSGAFLGSPVGEATLAWASDMDQFLLLAFERDQQMRAFDFIAPSTCPIDGVVTKVRELVEKIKSTPLRTFVREVLSLPDVVLDYWIQPGSLYHHHAFPGGLAEHSAEVAERASGALANDTTMRGVAIAYALLHDVGKVWAYSHGELTPEARQLGHEVIAHEHLLHAYKQLAYHWPDGALMMKSLLSGVWKREGRRPVVAVGNLIRSLDQMSAEDAMVRHAPPDRRPWRPRLV